MPKKIIKSGLLNLSALVRQAKTKHSAFWKKENGDVVCWISEIEDDKLDQYGNNTAIVLAGKKELREQEKSNDNFIANLKPNAKEQESEITDKDLEVFDEGSIF